MFHECLPSALQMLSDSHVLSHLILTVTPFQALGICELCPLMIQLDNQRTKTQIPVTPKPHA